MSQYKPFGESPRSTMVILSRPQKWCLYLGLMLVPAKTRTQSPRQHNDPKAPSRSPRQPREHLWVMCILQILPVFGLCQRILFAGVSSSRGTMGGEVSTAL